METTTILLFVALLSLSIFVITRLVKKHRFDKDEKQRQAAILQKFEDASLVGPSYDDLKTLDYFWTKEIEEKLTAFYQKKFFTTGIDRTEELRKLIIQFKNLDATDIRMRRAFIKAVINSSPENLAETVINSLTKDDGQEIKKFIIVVITINKYEEDGFVCSFIDEFNEKEKILPPGPEKEAIKATSAYILSIAN